LNTGFKNDPLFRQFSPIENAHICHRVANVLVPSMNIFGIFAALTWKCFSSCQLENFGNGVSIATKKLPSIHSHTSSLPAANGNHNNNSGFCLFFTFRCWGSKHFRAKSISWFVALTFYGTSVFVSVWSGGVCVCVRFLHGLIHLGNFVPWMLICPLSRGIESN